jgi:hypothetical protein
MIRYDDYPIFNPNDNFNDFQENDVPNIYIEP